jgi:predicted RNA-binding protein associated with RNAse of E/G family
VQLFWDGPERTFTGWYVNFQEPIRRTAEGFDTYDQELDIVIAADGSWRVKDDELMDPWIERGRFTVDEVAAIRAEGARVVARLQADERWWDDSWIEWQPDPTWTVP